MKKHILMILSGFLLLALLNACLVPFGCGCADPYLREWLGISMRDIKDPRVKTIKITHENLDGIKPQYEVYLKEISGVNIMKDLRGKHTIIMKRKERTYEGKKYYFEGFVVVEFIIDENAKNLDKKRTYELKMYINDELFFTKKFSFIIGKDYNSIIEFDNMEYVTKGEDIKVTDSDIKKWLDGKP